MTTEMEKDIERSVDYSRRLGERLQVLKKDESVGADIRRLLACRDAAIRELKEVRDILNELIEDLE